MRSRDDEKIKIIYANFFGVSPFKIDEEKSIVEQFGADYVDLKELSWIISEEYNTIVTEKDVISVSLIRTKLKKR